MCAIYEKLISLKSVNICLMEHRGEIIRSAVYKSGYSITDIAKRIGKSRRWMYLMFENSNVPLDSVIKIGKIIHYDFSEEIKEIRLIFNGVNDLQDNNLKENLNTDYWKDKYLKLLEEYNALLKKQENL
jgi:CRISPR/Cas system-associated exonuclease Cas4 (RecB family)